MCENNKNSNRTPLKSSQSANKPYRSPLIKRLLNQKTNKPELTEMKKHVNTLPLKRIVASSESPVEKKLQDPTICPNDLRALEKRICEKQNEIINLKSQSSNHQDRSTKLREDIKKWKNVCQQALERLYDTAKETESNNLSMGQVLASLGIPGELVDYSADTDWFLNSD